MNLRDKIAAGRAALRGGVVPVVAHDLFPTPPDVAARVAVYLRLEPKHIVLEPSAGTGALVLAIRDAEPGATLQAIEQDVRLARALGGSPEDRQLAPWVYCADFLSLPTVPTADRVAMNPPFSGGADVRHVEHAREFLKPGGVLVAIIADGPRQARYADAIGAEDLERLPAGSFTGTQVRARIIRWTRPTG